MLVIGLVGPKASGKETIAAYIAEKYGANHHSHSEILTDILDVLGLEHSRENEMKLVAMRKNFGMDVLPNSLRKKIQAENAKIQVITGIRFQNELDHVRSYVNSAVIFVDAPLELRFERQKLRDQKADDATMSFERFKEIEHAETEKEIHALGEQADFKVQNTGDESDLEKKVDEIMDRVLQGV